MSFDRLLEAVKKKRTESGKLKPSDERGRTRFLSFLFQRTVLSVREDYAPINSNRPDFSLSSRPNFNLSSAKEGYVVLEREEIIQALKERSLSELRELLKEKKKAVLFQTKLGPINLVDQGRSVLIKSYFSFWRTHALSEAALVFKRAFVRRDRELIKFALREEPRAVYDLSVYDLSRWLSHVCLFARPETDFRSAVVVFFLRRKGLKKVLERESDFDASEGPLALLALYALGEETPSAWKGPAHASEQRAADSTKEKIRLLAKALLDSSKERLFLSQEIFEIASPRKPKRPSTPIL